MNPNLNWVIVAERIQAVQAEADTARAWYGARVRRATARARRARRSPRGLALAHAG